MDTDCYEIIIDFEAITEPWSSIVVKPPFNWEHNIPYLMGLGNSKTGETRQHLFDITKFTSSADFCKYLQSLIYEFVGYVYKVDKQQLTLAQIEFFCFGEELERNLLEAIFNGVPTLSIKDVAKTLGINSSIALNKLVDLALKRQHILNIVAIKDKLDALHKIRKIPLYFGASKNNRTGRVAAFLGWIYLLANKKKLRGKLQKLLERLIKEKIYKELIVDALLQYNHQDITDIMYILHNQAKCYQIVVEYKRLRKIRADFNTEIALLGRLKKTMLKARKTDYTIEDIQQQLNNLKENLVKHKDSNTTEVQKGERNIKFWTKIHDFCLRNKIFKIDLVIIENSIQNVQIKLANYPK